MYKTEKIDTYQSKNRMLINSNDVPVDSLLGYSNRVVVEFVRLCRKLGMVVRTLRCIDSGMSLPMGICGNPAISGCKLVLAGIHGDEPAGVLGIIEFLRRWIKGFATTLREPDSPAIAFVPLIAPSAFYKSTRVNAWNENANRGYFPVLGIDKEISSLPSREGLLLLNNLDVLRLCATKGVLSLHEDLEANEFYLYAYEHVKLPSEFTYMMKQSGEGFFGIVKDDANFAEGPVKDGIIFNDEPIGALDELLFFAGSPNVFVTETPGRHLLMERVEATVAIIEAFLRFNKTI